MLYSLLFLISVVNTLNVPVLQKQDDSILPKLHDIGRKDSFRGNSSASILSNLAATPSLSKLYHIIQEYPVLADALADKNANYTLFAPVNSAIPHFKILNVNSATPHFKILNEDTDEFDLLMYHLVEPCLGINDLKDGQLLESGLNLATLGDKHQKIKVFKRYDHISLNWHAKVESVSIKASNGWIHLINAMLKPPLSLPSHLKYFPLKFSILSAALRRTGVSLILNEINGVTVFAPTNSAFVKLGWSKLRHLFSNEGVAELSAILLHHITPNLLYSQDIVDAKELYVRSLFRNQPLDILATPSGEIFVNDESKVVGLVDQLGHNGVLHPVDHVIMPKEEYLNKVNLFE